MTIIMAMANITSSNDDKINLIKFRVPR